MSSISHKDRGNLYRKRPGWRWKTGVFAILLLTGLMAVTTIGFFDRISLLVEQQRLGTLVAYLGVCAICWACLLAAAVQPRRLVRWGWATVLSLSLAASQAYYLVSGSELGPFDILSLWQASHEIGRAADQYTSAVGWFIAVFAVSTACIALFPTPRFNLWRAHGSKLAWLPALPVMLIGAIVVHKEGGGAQSLPQHFAPLAVSSITMAKSLTAPATAQRTLTAKPASQPAVRNIVMLVDESVRADYVDLTPGNGFTPLLAARSAQIVDFGAAASGGNCSHYSNALLRFGAAQGDIARTVKSNPSIWQYAKAAGYRTVFIDAQASVNKDASRLQNFMTAEEASHIDGLVSFDDVAIPDLDHRLMQVINAELAGPVPVFIYANKNGAHFPYHHGYRGDGTIPQDATAGAKAESIRTYINNLRWNVDHALADFLDNADLSETLVLYTSDHGQNFDPDRLTHCSVDNPDPREALVPMMAMTGDAALKAWLSDAAGKSFNRTSHFQLVASVIDIMGYRHDGIAEAHGHSLFAGPPAADAGFTTGDIFGLFRSQVRWNAIDLSADYLENEARNLAPSTTPVNVSAANELRPSYR